MTLYVNDRAGGWRAHGPHGAFPLLQLAGMDIGRDNGGVVDRRYESHKPFPFNGTVRKVVFDIQPHLAPARQSCMLSRHAPPPATH